MIHLIAFINHKFYFELFNHARYFLHLCFDQILPNQCSKNAFEFTCFQPVNCNSINNFL